MSLEAFKENIKHMKEIIREMYIFSNQLTAINQLESQSESLIDPKEKKLLINAINALTVQLKILNKSIPSLLENIYFLKELPSTNKKEEKPKKEDKLVQLKYKPSRDQPKVAVTVPDKDREEFLKNLSKSNLSIFHLKKKYAVEKPVQAFTRPNAYAKLSNRFFRGISTKWLLEKKLEKLNRDLRRMNSPFVVGTYVSMILLTISITLMASILLFILLLFYHLSIDYTQIFTPVEESILVRIPQVIWVIVVFPVLMGLLMWYYPQTEAQSMGKKIDRELPFVTIHMSAIATAGVEPTNIFRIILKNEEYKYANQEFRKLMNLINFQGYDLVRALKKIALGSPSLKLRELLGGLATTITSGGDMHTFLDKHAEELLFDYKLEREKYTKTAETFMDIYISVVIAAPMIMLMLFVIMGSTAISIGGLNAKLMGTLIIILVAGLNIGFLVLLKLKQPAF